MLTALSETFDRFLATHFPKFDPIDQPEDWHLRLLWLPDGKPETVYDLDYRDGKLSIVLTRFLESAWKKYWKAFNEKAEKVSVKIEIGSMELPDDHPVIECVADGLPRFCQDRPTAILDGEQFKLWLWDGLGAYTVEVWEPFALELEDWVRLIDVVRDACGLVPREFLAKG